MAARAKAKRKYTRRAVGATSSLSRRFDDTIAEVEKSDDVSLILSSFLEDDSISDRVKVKTLKRVVRSTTFDWAAATAR